MMNREVGDPCEKCGTPLIAGKKGPYCKPCYIEWAESNKLKAVPPPQKTNSDNKKVFEAKDRTLMAQTAWKATSEIFQGSKIPFETAKKYADEIYLDIGLKRMEELKIVKDANKENQPF